MSSVYVTLGTTVDKVSKWRDFPDIQRAFSKDRKSKKSDNPMLKPGIEKKNCWSSKNTYRNNIKSSDGMMLFLGFEEEFESGLCTFPRRNVNLVDVIEVNESVLANKSLTHSTHTAFTVLSQW